MEEEKKIVQKKAKWMAISYNPVTNFKIRCSACGYTIFHKKINPAVCPECQARMTNFRDNPMGWVRAKDSYLFQKIHP